MAADYSPRRESPALRAATRAFVETFLAEVLPDLRLAARGCGYALAVHGSLARDVDLLAAPWTESASDPDELADRLCGVLAGKVGNATRAGGWTDKPHGRRAQILALAGRCPEIDLSVMPRRVDPAKECDL